MMAILYSHHEGSSGLWTTAEDWGGSGCTGEYIRGTWDCEEACRVWCKVILLVSAMIAGEGVEQMKEYNGCGRRVRVGFKDDGCMCRGQGVGRHMRVC